MLTLRWLLTSYALAFLALVVVLLAGALFAAILSFSTWVILIGAPVVSSLIFGAVYRKGIAKGASSSRPLRLALAGSWLFLGAFAAYLAYATTSWVLYRGQPEHPVPGLWTYLAKPSAVHSLFRREAHGFQLEDMGFFCVLGAMLTFGSSVVGLRNPAAESHRVASPELRFSCPFCSWVGEPVPAASVGDVSCGRCGGLVPGGTMRRTQDPPVVDTKSGQRGAGLLLALLAGGGMVLMWRAPRPLGSGFEVPAFIVPIVLVFGLGLLFFPLDPGRLRAQHQVYHATGFSHFPKMWVVVPIVGIAAGLLNWWLL